MTQEIANLQIIEKITHSSNLLSSLQGVVYPNTYLIRVDGEPAAVHGHSELWPGVGQLWGIYDEEICANHGRYVVKETRKDLAHVVHKHGYRQVRCLCIDWDAVRFCRLIGFEPESIWHDAGPEGNDVFVVLYTRRN